MYGFAEGFANRVGAFGEFAAGLRAEVLAPFLARAHFLFMYFLQTSFAHRLWHLADLLPFLHFLASLHFFLSARSSHGGSEGDMGGGGGGCTQT